MYIQVFTSLLLTALLGTSLSRSVSTSYQGDGEFSKQAEAVPGLDMTRRNSHGVLTQRDLSEHLSQDQKHLISQFLPHLFAAELAAKEDNLQEIDAHFPSWMDFGRRSSED
ncbi:gastrin/cholecystokinin-like peptide [Elgaria multicarinata webbii]|uniref:gastrin/cholecystokinin-like peptide n=1 Tax=Elgaria multicarinata webbii TaxID=159646 RepID=UPI002FCCF1D2